MKKEEEDEMSSGEGGVRRGCEGKEWGKKGRRRRRRQKRRKKRGLKK